MAFSLTFACSCSLSWSTNTSLVRLWQRHPFLGSVPRIGPAGFCRPRSLVNLGRTRLHMSLDVPVSSSSLNRTSTLSIDNMRCGSCVSRVESIILATCPPGTRATVNLLTNTAEIELPPQISDSSAIFDTICCNLLAGGFPCRTTNDKSRNTPNTSENKNTQSFSKRDMLISLCIVLASFAVQNFCCGSMASMVLQGKSGRLMSAILAVLFIVFPCRDIVREGLLRILDGSLSMDSLVTCSVMSQMAISMYALTSGTVPPRFHEIILLLTLVKLGRILEHVMRLRVIQNTQALSQLQPAECDVLVDGGDSNQSVLVRKTLRDVLHGDTIVVQSGARFPVDAEILMNKSVANGSMCKVAVDNSVITGEGRPSYLQVGDPVFAGSINLNSRPVLCLATSTGESSHISLAMKTLAEAARRKSVTQRIADKAAAVLTRIALAVAALSFTYFSATQRSLSSPVFRELGPAAPALIAGSVLSAACPCGFALAVPLIVLVAISAGANQGILFRGGAAVEKSGAHFDAIALDKTGTLTTGDMKVINVGICPDVHCWISAPRLSKLVAAIEKSVLHPVAFALKRYGDSVSCENAIYVPPTSVRHVVGCGVEAEISLAPCGVEAIADIVRIGTSEWISDIDCNVTIPENMQKNRQVRVFVHCKALGGLLGYFDVVDELRATPQDIQDLRQRCSTLAILSGDETSRVSTVAEAVGVSAANGDIVLGNLKPHDKVRVLSSRRRNRNYSKTCAIGDGVNDAPLLSSVYVGIALGNSKEGHGVADIAAAAADVLIPYGGIELAKEAMIIGNWSRNAIYLSLCWSAVYNVAALFVTAGILLPFGIYIPAHAAAMAMSLSSTVVIGIAAVLAAMLERRRQKRVHVRK